MANTKKNKEVYEDDQPPCLDNEDLKAQWRLKLKDKTRNKDKNWLFTTNEKKKKKRPRSGNFKQFGVLNCKDEENKDKQKEQKRTRMKRK